MRLHPILSSALYTGAILVGKAHGDIVGDVVEDIESATSIVGSVTSSVAERPTFTVGLQSSVFREGLGL